MLTLQSKLQHIGKALSDALPGLVSHYYRPEKKTFYPFLVWAEDMEGDSLYTDNHKAEQVIHCVADYYTQTEYDPNLDTIQSVLDGFGCSWRIELVQYEEDTNLIHYTFEFEVREIGDTF